MHAFPNLIFPFFLGGACEFAALTDGYHSYFPSLPFPLRLRRLAGRLACAPLATQRSATQRNTAARWALGVGVASVPGDRPPRPRAPGFIQRLSRGEEMEVLYGVGRDGIGRDGMGRDGKASEQVRLLSGLAWLSLAKSGGKMEMS